MKREDSLSCVRFSKISTDTKLIISNSILLLFKQFTNTLMSFAKVFVLMFNSNIT